MWANYSALCIQQVRGVAKLLRPLYSAGEGWGQTTPPFVFSRWGVWPNYSALCIHQVRGVAKLHRLMYSKCINGILWSNWKRKNLLIENFNRSCVFYDFISHVYDFIRIKIMKVSFLLLDFVTLIWALNKVMV